MTEHHLHSALPAISGSRARRALMWVMLSVLSALITFFAFRGYLNPELLFNFANYFYC